MAAGALAPDLDSGGVGAWVRGRPVVVGVAATVVLALAVGFLATFRLLGQKPLPVLRRE